MPNPVRITMPLRLVLDVVLSQPLEARYGLDLAKATGLKSGSLYPILVRLEDAGWLTSFWEDTTPEEAGRPRRRYYKLSPLGQARATAILRETPPVLVKRLQLGVQP